jgi:hypothetical protein
MVDFDTLKRTAFAWQDGARELICAANILLASFEDGKRGQVLQSCSRAATLLLHGTAPPTRIYRRGLSRHKKNADQVLTLPSGNEGEPA